MDALSFYKSLSDDTRLQASLLIQQHGELCVCELVTALSISQPKVSRHLAQLRDAGLLLATKRGQWVYYSLAPTLPAWCRDVLQLSASANDAYLNKANTALGAMLNRPDCQP